jgi:hypothetical protein
VEPLEHLRAKYLNVLIDSFKRSSSEMEDWFLNENTEGRDIQGKIILQSDSPAKIREFAQGGIPHNLRPEFWIKLLDTCDDCMTFQAVVFVYSGGSRDL